MHVCGQCDYPDVAKAVCVKVLSGEAARGIVVCGTGIGISIACNKVEGIRCALAHDHYTAQMSREVCAAPREGGGIHDPRSTIHDPPLCFVYFKLTACVCAACVCAFVHPTFSSFRQLTAQ
jgi:hypothetical protein